jgi:hypothetical protein
MLNYAKVGVKLPIITLKTYDSIIVYPVKFFLLLLVLVCSIDDEEGRKL